jgi:hypothetical protein
LPQKCARGARKDKFVFKLPFFINLQFSIPLYAGQGYRNSVPHLRCRFDQHAAQFASHF